MKRWMIPAVALAAVSLSVRLSGQAASSAPPSLGAASLAVLDSMVPAIDDPDREFARIYDPALGRTAASEVFLDLAEPMVARVLDPRKALQRVDAFLASEPHPLARRVALDHWAALQLRLGAADEVLAAEPFGDYVQRVHVVGPLGDEGNYYNGVVLAPELRFPVRGESVPGRFGPVRVRAVSRRPLSHRLELAPPNTGLAEGCYYALHRFESRVAATGYVEITCLGSYELFFDGERIADLDRLIDRDRLAVSRHAFRFGSGRHQVLFKSTLNARSWFAMRYLDAAGKPLEGLAEVFEEPIEAPQVDADQELPPIGGAFVGGLERLEEAARASGTDPSDEAHAVRLLATMAAGYGRTEARALDLLERVDATPPDANGRLGPAYVAVVRSVDILPPTVRRGRTADRIEALAKALPKHHNVRLWRAKQLADQDRREDAVRMLQAAVTDGTAGPSTFRALHDQLTGLGAVAEADLLRRVWGERLPQDPQVARLDADRLNWLNDPHAALARLKAALAASPSQSLRARTRSQAVRCGEFALAKRLIEQSTRPNSAARWSRLASLYAHWSDHEADALAAYEALAAHEEASPVGRAGAAVELHRAGRSERALVALRRAVAADPDDVDVRRLLMRLEGRRVDAEFSPFRLDALAAMRSFEAGEAERSATATLVLDQMLVSVAPDGSAIEETHTLRRINDRRGVEQYQEAADAADADQLLELRTLLVRDQSIDEFRPTKVDKKYGMPRLEPGAFIESRFRNFQGTDAPGPMRIVDFRFQSAAEPYGLSQLVLILPKRFPGEFKLRNFTGKRETKPLANGRVAHVFTMRDVPRLPSERMRPPTLELIPVVQYGEDRVIGPYERSAFVAAEYRAGSSSVTRKRAERVTMGLESDLAKAEAIWRDVCEHVAGPEGSADATATLLQKQGSRISATAAMLRDAGVPFRWVAAVSRNAAHRRLAEPLYAGDINYGLPGLRIEPRSGPVRYLLKDAARYQPLGLLSVSQLGAPVLVFDSSGEPRLGRLPADVDGVGTGVQTRGVLTLTPKRIAELAVETQFVGKAGYALAERLRALEDNVIQVAGRQLGSQLYRGWSIRDIQLAGIREPGQSLRAKASLRKRRGATPDGDSLVVELPIIRSDLLQSFGDRGERKLPLRITTSQASRHTIDVDVGPERRIIELPKPLRVRRMLVDFELSFERLSAHRIRLRHMMSVRAGEIPAAMVADWVGLLRRLDLAETQRIRVR